MEGSRRFGFMYASASPFAPTIDTHEDLERGARGGRGPDADHSGLAPGAAANPIRPSAKITLRDGRTLAYMDRGPRTGTPVLYFHGFQGSRLERIPGLEEILARLNIRLISPDRPASDFPRRRMRGRLTGWASDVRQLTEGVLGPGQPFSILGFPPAPPTRWAAAGSRTARHGSGERSGAATSDRQLGAVLEGRSGVSCFRQSWRTSAPPRFSGLKSSTADRLSTLGVTTRKIGHSLSADDQRILARPEVEELFQENRRESYAEGPGCLLQEVQALYSDRADRSAASGRMQRADCAWNGR